MSNQTASTEATDVENREPSRVGVTLDWLATIGLGPPQAAFWDGGFSVYFEKQWKWLNFDARTTRPDFLEVMRILGETINHEAS